MSNAVEAGKTAFGKAGELGASPDVSIGGASVRQGQNRLGPTNELGPVWCECLQKPDRCVCVQLSYCILWEHRLELRPLSC